MLRLLGVGALQLVAGRTPIPEVSAEEQILSLIELELGEVGRIRVSLRRSLGGSIAKGSGICDHGQINGWDRPAKASIRHVTERTGLVLERRHILVEIQQPAENPHRVISGWKQCWGLACQRRRRQCLPLGEIETEDGLNFASNP